MISCCKDCTSEKGRHIGCHADCKAYLEERGEHIERNREIKRQRYNNNQIMGYFADDKERRRRRG